MINAIAAKLISHIFNNFIESIDSSNLETGIWNGYVHLDNLVILENALINQQLPFKVKQGTIGSLSISLPWMKLNSESSTIEISDVFIILDVCGSVLVNIDLQNVPEIEENENNQKQSSSSILNGLLLKIIDNLNVKIKNIHIRLESKSTECSYVAFGLTIPLIEAFTVDDDGNPIFLNEHRSILKKKLSIKDFAIYIDTDVAEIEKNMFYERMKKEIEGKHQYILKPFTFDSILTHCDDGSTEFKNDLDIVATSLKLGIDILQYRGLFALKEQYQKFNKQRIYSQCGKPDRLPRSARSSGLWWRYLHRTTLVKNKIKKFDVRNAIEFFRNRKEYYNLFCDVKNGIVNSKLKLEAFEENIEQNTIAQLRSYCAGLSYWRSESISDQITQKEIDDLIQNNNKLKNTFGLNLKIESMTFSLFEKQNEVLTNLSMNELFTRFTKIDFDTETKFNISSLNIINNGVNRVQFPKILETYSDQSLFGSISTKLNEPIKVSFNFPSLKLIANVEYISKIINFLKIDKDIITNNVDEKDGISSATKLQLKSAIESKKEIDVHIHMNTAKLILPYIEIEENEIPTLELSINSVDIKSIKGRPFNIDDFSTLYNNYFLNAKGIELSLNKRYIIKSIDICSKIQVAIAYTDLFQSLIVSIESTSIPLMLTTNQLLLIMQMKNYIQDVILSTNSETKSLTFSPEKSISVKVPNLIVNLSYDDIPFYKICLTNETSISINIKNQTINILVYIDEIEGFESIVGGDLFKAKRNGKIQVNGLITNEQIKLNVNLGNVNFNAKSKAINYLFLFAKFPNKYDALLKLTDVPMFQKIKYPKAINEKNTHVNVSINIDESIVNGIYNNKEFAKVFINSIMVNVNVKGDDFKANISINDACLKTDLVGKWNTLLHNNSPINLSLTPLSIDAKLNNIEAVIYPQYLIILLKFLKELKNTHLGINGNPDLISHMAFNIAVNNLKVKLLYLVDTDDFIDFYLEFLNFYTIKSPIIHKIDVNNILLSHKSNPILKFNALSFDILFDFFVKKEEDLIFDKILETKTIKQLFFETDEFIKNESSISVLSKTFYWFYGIHIKACTDGFQFYYNRSLATQIVFILESLFKFIADDEAREEAIYQPLNIDISADISDILTVIKDIEPFITLKLNTFNLDFKQDDISVFIKAAIILHGNDIVFQSSDKFLNCHLVDNNLDVIIEDSTFIFLPELVPTIFASLVNIPFLHLKIPDKLIKDKNKSTNIKLRAEKTHFKIPFEKTNSLFDFNGAIFLDIIDGKLAIDINNITGIIQRYQNDISPLLDSTSVKIRDSLIEFNDIFFKFSVLDIYLFEILIKSFQKITIPTSLNKKNNDFVSDTVFSLLFKNIIIMITQPNLPFISLEILPFSFHQTFEDNIQKREISINMHISHRNYLLNSWDYIIEPFTFSFNSEITSLREKFTLNFSPINIHLCYSVIKEVLTLLNLLKAERPQNYNIREAICTNENSSIFIKNKLGLPCNILSGNNKIKIEKSQKIKINEIDKLITIEFENEKETISIDNLFHPICFKDFIIYMKTFCGIRKVIISSPYYIENKTLCKVQVTINDMNIGTINSNKKIPISLSYYLPFNLSVSEVNIPYFEKVVISKWGSSVSKHKMATKECNMNVCIRTFVRDNLFGIVSIYPSLIFVNELPIPIKIKVSDNPEIRIESGKRKPIPFEEDKINHSINTTLCIDGFINVSKKISIQAKPKQHKFTLISENNSIKFYVAYICEYDPDILQSIIYFYSPCIIFNCTKLPLSIYRNSKEINCDFQDFQDQKICLYATKDYFRKNELKANLYIPNTTNQSKPFDCISSSKKSKLLLEYINDNTLFVPIQYQITKPGKFYTHTYVITLTLPLFVYNHFDMDIILNPSNNDNNQYTTIHAYERKMISRTNKTFTFDLTINGYQKCMNIPLNAPKCTVIRVLNETDDFFIEINIIKEGDSFCAHFRKPTLPGQITVSNMLSLPIRLTQAQSKRPYNVSPYSSSLFALDTLDSDLQILISIKNKNYTIGFEGDCQQRLLGSGPYFVEITTVKNGGQLIIINESQNPKGFYREIYVNLNLCNLTLSLIDQKMRELLLLTLDKLKLEVEPKVRNNYYKITLDTLKIDDAFSSSKFPVVLIGKSNNNSKFISIDFMSSFEVPMFSSFENLHISINNIGLNVDLSFASDVFSLFSLLYSLIQNDENVLQPYLSKSFVEPNKIISYYSFSTLHIEPISIYISFRATTGRPFSQKPSDILPINYLRFIPNISSAPVETREVLFNNIRIPVSFLKDYLILDIQKDIIKKGIRIIGHSDVFFNATGIASTVGTGIKAIVQETKDKRTTTEETMGNIGGNISGLFKKTGSQIAKGAGGVIRTFSSLIHTATFDQQTKTQEYNYKQPFLVRNIANVIDKGADLIDGLSNKIVHEEALKKERNSSAFPFSRVLPYNFQTSNAQFLFQTMKSPNPLWNEVLYMLINEPSNYYAIGIFDHFIVFYTKDIKEILNVINISEINYINHNAQFLEFHVNGDEKFNKFNIKCDDVKTASIAEFILTSKKNAMEMFQPGPKKKHALVLHKENKFK